MAPAGGALASGPQRQPHALRKIQRINRAWRRSACGRRVPRRTRKPRSRNKGTEAAGAAPIEHSVTISLEEACTGCSRGLHGQWQTCADCGGTGPPPLPAPCGECDARRIRPHLWSLAVHHHGMRRLPWARQQQLRCASCEGSGRAGSQVPLPRALPAGARAGTVLNISAGYGGQHHHEIALRAHRLQRHPLFTLDADGGSSASCPWTASPGWPSAGSVPTPRGLRDAPAPRPPHLPHQGARAAGGERSRAIAC